MNRIDLEKHNEKMEQDLIKRKTDIQCTEEKLQRLKENFARAFKACPAALAITRMADGKFLEINTAYIQIMGYEPHETLGRTTTEMDIYVNPRERNLLMQQLQDQGCVRDYELQVRNKSGDIRTLLVSMEPIAYGKEPTLIWAFVDLTELKQKTAELEDINTALNVMLKKREQDNQMLEEMLRQKIASGLLVH